MIKQTSKFKNIGVRIFAVSALCMIIPMTVNLFAYKYVINIAGNER